ncbi:TPA: hypothetical protein ACG3JQ_003882, partial [Clostridioides difficile]
KEIQENDAYRFKDANNFIKELNKMCFTNNETREIGFQMSFGINNGVFMEKNIILGQYRDMDLKREIISTNEPNNRLFSKNLSR